MRNNESSADRACAREETRGERSRVRAPRAQLQRTLLRTSRRRLCRARNATKRASDTCSLTRASAPRSRGLWPTVFFFRAQERSSRTASDSSNKRAEEALCWTADSSDDAMRCAVNATSARDHQRMRPLFCSRKRPWCKSGIGTDIPEVYSAGSCFVHSGNSVRNSNAVPAEEMGRP